MPDFTVVIPARNEATYLPLTLQALEKQTKKPAAVIVVDNGSSDTTAQIAASWGAQVLHCPERGVARARQTGLEAATTEWIATTDADSLPIPEWLEVLDQATANALALYGPMRFCGLAPHWEQLSGVAYSGFLHVCRVIGRPNLAAANMAFSRQAALMAGGYPMVEAHEDVILGQEISKFGKIKYVPGALVETSSRRLDKGLLPFLWQHIQNLRGHTRGYFGDDRLPPPPAGR